MEKDIEILENMRDNIYGAMQFEDDYQVTELEKKQFNALNLAIKSINRVKELEECLEAEEKYAEGLNRDIKSLLNIEPNNNFISKSKIKEKIEELDKLIKEAQIELGSASKEFTIYVYQKDILQELLEE